MLVPPPPGFITPLHFTEVLAGEASRRTLDEEIKRVDWRGVVEVVSGITSVSWQDGIEDPTHQTALLKNLASALPYYPELIARLDADAKRRVFTRESLLAVLRVAVTLQRENSVTPAEFNDAFVRSVLIANEILGQEVTPPAPQGTAVDLLPSELRSQVLHFDQLHDLLARNEAFFAWTRTPKAQGSPYALAAEDDFARFTGLPWRRYAASAYMCLGRCVSMGHTPYAGNLPVLYDLDQWLAGVHDTSSVTQWFASSRVDIVTLRAAWEPAQSLSFAASGLLWRRPVVRAENGKYFIPYAPLVQNAMGDGVFYLLLDGYAAAAADGSLRKRFTQFFGEFFQDYVAERLTNGYAGRPDAEVRTEKEYWNGPNLVLSTDVIVAENGDMFFLEVMAKRPNLLEAVVALKDDGIEADASAFVAKARELDKRIRDFRDGLYFADLPRPAGQRIFPIIVTPTSWPRVHLLNTVLPAVIAHESLLANTQPIELLDANDVELLEGALNSGFHLGDLLRRKNGDGRPTDARFKSLHDYLVYYEPNLFQPRPGRIRGTQVAREIMELAQTWTTPPV